ncbi:DUF4189 domain-containing protein [Nocardia arizonensis]|uniref:DUF4189 domain-containing protein n=1 Tax=Nocardia arizonensis TaxID=1141647 RepID=UPI0006D10008|nr:DUF4189 domain-containing protein [Nocardia arizonensis]
MSVLRKGALAVAVTSIAAAGVGAGIADAAGSYYGTLAVSRSTGKVVAAVDHPTRVKADAEAIRECAVYDCELVQRFVDGCAAIARGADGKYGWAAAATRTEAEQIAIASLGESTPPFPDLGSAQPRPAEIAISACTANAN